MVALALRIPRNRAVYRLLPGMGADRGDDYRTLTIGSELTRILRWQLSGSPDDYPSGISAEWVGDPHGRPVELATGATEAPIVSSRIADLHRADFEAAGSLLPLCIDGVQSSQWLLFLVEAVVDCLDVPNSSEPEWDGTIRTAVFRADAVPADLPAFRVPQSTKVYWTGWAVDRLVGLVGVDLEARLVWSEDAARTPIPTRGPSDAECRIRPAACPRGPVGLVVRTLASAA